MIPAGLLLVGLAVLALAAREFVTGSSRLAVALGISPVVIGAVVIGFGTSAPELLVSTLAAAEGSPEIAAGNVVGSNVANLTLVLGLAALAMPLEVASGTLRREAPVSALAALAFVVVLRGAWSRVGGALLLGALGALMWWFLRRRPLTDPALEREVGEFLGAARHHSVRAEAVRVVAGLGGTLVGAQLVVLGARGLAERLGLAEGFVGLSIVALGTSLPEVVTCLQAALKREGDLILGNLLGSNMINSLGVGGAAALAGPGTVADPSVTGVAAYVMLAVAAAAWVFMASARRVTRWEGAVLVVGYALLLPLFAR